MGRPPRGVAITVLAGILILSGGIWLALQPSEAPASTAPPGHLVASAAQIRVIDGATLLLRDRAVQLAGVLAAERGSVCVAAGGTRMDCGVAAANALGDLIRDVAVDCSLNGAGQGGRPLAVCDAGGRDINLAMIAGGWARAEPDNMALGDAERLARAEHRGLWAGPWANSER